MAHQRALCAKHLERPHHLFERQWSLVGRLWIRSYWPRENDQELSLKRLESSGNEQQEARSIDDASWALARESQINRYMRMCTHEKRLKER